MIQLAFFMGIKYAGITAKMTRFFIFFYYSKSEFVKEKMLNNQKKNSCNWYQILFWSILALACAVRFAMFGEIPQVIHQDEAMTGYEAFSLFLSGADSRGVMAPVYLTAWGSGTSVLYAWLAKLCFMAFGVSVWALRLPQVIISVLGCYVFYRLLRIIFDKKTALFGFFLMSIMPWSVMSGRWGLDANIAPTFCLLGFYFYCRAIKQIRYLYLSALFYALTMYAYAAYWLFLLVILPLLWGYFLWSLGKRVRLTTIMSAVLCAVLVLPLLLLVLVNSGVIGEIRTPYLSVPKMLFWRGGEVSFDDLLFKMTILFNILIKQNDGWLTNMVPQYGLFYLFTPILMLLGGGRLVQKVRQDWRQRQFSFALLILGQIIVGLIYAALLYSFSNRISFLFVPLMIAAVFGARALMPYKRIFYAVTAAYLVSFICFVKMYFTRYNEMLAENYSYSFSYGIEEALAKAENLHQKYGYDIYFLEEPYLYAKVLFLSQVSPEEYRQTVQWYNYPDAFLQARSFLYYHFESTADFGQLKERAVYVVHKNRYLYFSDVPYKVYGNYIVVVK